MSSIDRMMILGVRAFPTTEGETIKFEPPLTIVAGTNGSGKTTIIECLRFITTGALPPGAGLKGAWIHDPGLQGEKSVLAQVKLLFHAANGTKLVVTRNLELQLKKQSRSQKTKEATLLIERHGQKTALSTRVAELDEQVPLYLGVSTSLLDNVIFCHQEDSQWPLAESGTLKKKFDEIFEAGKYTKAVKELVDIRKKHKNDLGRQEALAESAKKDRDRANRVRQRCKQLHKEIEDLREQARDWQNRFDSASTGAAEKWKQAEQVGQKVAVLEAHRMDRDNKEKMVADLKVHLKEIGESDEWLENALAQFNATLAGYEETKQTKGDQWLEYKENLAQLKEKLDIKLTEQGQYQQERVEHNRQLERRKNQIRESAAKHQLRGYDDLSDDDKVEDFLFKIKKLAKDRTTKLEQARAEADQQKREATTTLNKLTERQNVLKDNRTSANRQMAENSRQAAQRQSDVDNVQVNEGSKAAIESRMEELQVRLLSTRQNLNSMDYPAKIKQANQELSRFDEELNRLNAELLQSTKRAGEVAQLSHVKQEIREQQRGLRTLLEVHSDKINTLVGSGWDPTNLNTKFQGILSNAVKEVASAKRERDNILREAEQIQYKQRSLRDELGARKRQAQQYEKIVKDAIDGDIADYEETSSAAELRLETATENMKEYGGLATWFGRVLEIAESKHACRLCERPFKGPDDPRLNVFKRKVQTLVARASAEAADEELQEATADHKRIIDAGASYENWKRVTKEEIPTMDTDIAKLNKDHERSMALLEKHDRTVEAKEEAQNEIESLSTTVVSITKIEQDIKSLNAKVDELTAKQSQHGDIRTLEDIQEEITTINGKAYETKRNVSRMTKEQDTARSETYAQELELREMRSELETVSRQLDRKTGLLDRVQEFKDMNQKQREIIGTIDTELENIGPQIDAANAKRDDVDQRANARLRDMNQDARGLDETVSALQLVNDQIQTYVQGGSESKLSRIVREIGHIRQEIARDEAAQKQLTKEISQVDEQLRDSDNTRRRYADNLRYRELCRDLKWLQGEIETLESTNAEHDQDQLKRESEQLTRDRHACAAQLQGVVGESKTKDLQLKELLAEYDTDLKDAALRYRQAHVKVESTKLAVEDIGKYSTALDQAVTKYHSLKMDQVNAIMDELWRNTYMGTDVDTIYIKSDLEVKTSSRTHHYRVVMLKRDVELDMRGRCSAGQKVLASIIIRLALAECFSKDCGVIALDEPTTNLDEKNIEALALSLHRIIESRRHQKNFQLIIITHDERFLELLNAQDFIDNYYIVRRDEHDNSVIEKQSILRIMRK
ncbi:DNA repair protein rad50 [Lithohypha guttulata]|nr:DNA repair protein rad50 [Lithohypha guttulata]